MFGAPENDLAIVVSQVAPLNGAFCRFARLPNRMVGEDPDELIRRASNDKAFLVLRGLASHTGLCSGQKAESHCVKRRLPLSQQCPISLLCSSSRPS